MYQDRGNIKWTAMMLPEHVREIRKWRKEVDDKPPEKLNSWEQEEIELVIKEATHFNNEVSLWIYKEKWSLMTGIIEEINDQDQIIHLFDGLVTKYIPFQLIYHAELHD